MSKHILSHNTYLWAFGNTFAKCSLDLYTTLQAFLAVRGPKFRMRPEQTEHPTAWRLSGRCCCTLANMKRHFHRSADRGKFRITRELFHRMLIVIGYKNQLLHNICIRKVPLHNPIYIECIYLSIFMPT